MKFCQEKDEKKKKTKSWLVVEVVYSFWRPGIHLDQQFAETQMCDKWKPHLAIFSGHLAKFQTRSKPPILISKN